MPLNPAGSACRCGSVGCWETEVGEDALLARAGRERGGGRDAVASVLHDASSGDERAQAALEHVGQWLGYGLAGLVNVLNPELIVLGGLFGRIYEQIADTVELRLDRYALADARRLVRVVPAALGEDAPLLGAAELAFETFLGDPAAWLRPRPALVELATA
jgi:predicted NBD/HSP70 family sugar kinase